MEIQCALPSSEPHVPQKLPLLFVLILGDDIHNTQYYSNRIQQTAAIKDNHNATSKHIMNKIFMLHIRHILYCSVKMPALTVVAEISSSVLGHFIDVLDY